MIYLINGLDIVPMLAENGVEWQRGGVDGPDAGRTMDLTMHRDFLGYKSRCNISCVWLTKTETVALYEAIAPEFVTVITDTVPWIDGIVTLTMYSNNYGNTLSSEYSDGTKIYTDVNFPVIER